MKRGFLNTEKAKRTLEPAADPANTNDNTSTRNDTAIPASINASHAIPPLDLHSIPKSIQDSPAGTNRFIFRLWPRDPKGKPILPSKIRGKEAGNGLDLWGATLYDFYLVRRLPENVHALTISTGSKLKKVMEAFGELEHAKDELAWAAREEDPKEVLPWDPAQAIESYERRVLSHIQPGIKKDDEECLRIAPSAPSERCDTTDDIEMLGAAEPPAHTSGLERSFVGSASDAASDNGKTEWTKTHPMAASSDTSQEFRGGTSSPFHPLHYPSPWPFTPFEAPHTPFTLHRGIPIHLLPKKLHVHDPWNVVEVDTNDEDVVNEANESWTSKNDNVLTYTLHFPLESQKAAEEAAEAAAVAQDEALKRRETILIPPQDFEGPTDKPAIRAILPQRPRRLTEVPEAHLYLSPKGKLGSGNHSTVHAAEWELPRDLFCESTICDDCLKEQVRLEVERLKESGEWMQRLEQAAKDYESHRKREEISQGSATLDDKDTLPEAETSANNSSQRKTVGFVKVKIESQPMETIEMVASSGPGEAPAADAPSLHFARVSDEVIKRYFEYEGPVITVHPDVKWQNPSLPSTICKHQAMNKKPVPRTAIFRVAAKLSIPGDHHLYRETRNYLQFPAHFFQHWNGYNVVPPLHDPTPVGALVPQFFGYYTCDSQPEGQYRSPILLIEHCGRPINVKKLSTDDRHECAALLFRFHAAGWIHESFAERNILMQEGQPTRSPLEEDKGNRPHSFRLIDFGRSKKYTDKSLSAVEESMGRKFFHLL